MSRLNLALASGAVSVTGSNLTWVIVVAVVALLRPRRGRRAGP